MKSLVGSILILNQWYGLVIISVLVLALLCFLIGLLVVGSYRRKDTYNTQIKSGGYPDMGSGFYSQRLDYHSWLIFNKSQRTHLQFVEILTISIVSTLLGGLTFPITSAVMCFVNALGRLFYLSYISSKGASHPLRLIGALMSDNYPLYTKYFAQIKENYKFISEIGQGGFGIVFLAYNRINRHLTENEAAQIMRQLFSAVSYIHANNIVHRDLKPENFILKHENDIKSMKMIDFGLSQIFQKGQILKQQSGTPFYIAPEVIEGQYGEEVDNWALGVILYIILSGSPPFYGKTNQEIFYRIRKCQYNLNLEEFQQCSLEVKDLLTKLLVRNPKKRISAMESYNHVWVQQEVSREMANLVISQSAFKGLEKICNLKQIKKTLLVYMATQIQEKDVENLKKIFLKIDTNGNGMISEEELLLGIQQFKRELNIEINDDQAKRIFQAMDFDNSGQIDYTEFIASFINNPEFQNDQLITQAFLKIDQNNDGKISRQEIQELLQNNIIPLGDQEVEQLIKEADLDGDGEVQNIKQKIYKYINIKKNIYIKIYLYLYIYIYILFKY
ncbi:hypothetical protein IMG5_182680 [Ichthyophthirius multifiliis]|uniref:Protein kinase domain protein n=1 Tax=Ichthyophthirius multifiliis TaxID=5932 RepID=G0R325_ICHMU|nr:hypothetical protein IMG5_182680 [Ichthyophthirius multifiliis]EGR28131.1 hypothetical protein IMG5_182680 [Ichthyophthirius multifiliis]|eukprot:XP_004027476.1 hypothetical protein IMG5_182680 [Ichthyophthirius multifiliis]